MIEICIQVMLQLLNLLYGSHCSYEEVLNLVDFTAVSIVDNELAIAPRRVL